MASTRPYLLVFKGEKHIIEAPGAAHAVQHVVGADISELRPARAAEVSAWIRGGGEVPVVEPKGVVASAPAPAAATGTPDTAPAAAVDVEQKLDRQAAALVCFEDWAGYDRTEEVHTSASADTVAAFSRMHPAGRMDLMTFDVLRQRAPEFGYAIIAREMGIPRGEDADYVSQLKDVETTGLARVRAQLEDAPMAFEDVVTAILRHAGLEEPAETVAAEPAPATEPAKRRKAAG